LPNIYTRPAGLNLPEPFSLVGERMIVARKSSPDQTVEVETPVFFAFFTTQCYEKAIIGATAFFGQFLQPAKCQTIRNFPMGRRAAREGQGYKKVPLDSSQREAKICGDLGTPNRPAPISVHPRIS
jgi:hypothetical protein